MDPKIIRGGARITGQNRRAGPNGPEGGPWQAFANQRFDRRHGDRRMGQGRRKGNRDFSCFSAPFLTHCLNQFGDSRSDRLSAIAAQTYKKANRRPR
ncbi:MAG: hypothetical protein ACE5EM_08725 [Sphingomonadales bacterium]